MNKIMRFLRGESGSIVPIVGLGIAAIVGATGVAVDVGRAQLVQAKLSSSLDAAGLAAGSTVSTTNVNSEVTKYLNANFKNYLGSTVTLATPVVSADSSTITLSASATLPTTFMRIFGKTTMKVAATSEITRQSSGLELVMVLDNTGSMSNSIGGVTKLTSLKNAANELVDTLYGSNTTVSNLWIGLVPFSQAVNVGPTRTSWLASNSFNWKGIAWAGCVDAREASNRDTTDDPPSVALFPQYFWPDDSNNDWLTSGGSVRSGIGVSKGPNKSCPQAVTPMTANKTTILDAIDDMAARGNTHIGLGAAWGWRMISPRWQGLWGGEMNTNNLPLAYNTPKMNKAVIIMTDGDNTIDNSNHGAYWYLSDNKLGTTTQSTAETQLDARLSTVCTNMKNNNIVVYTISFGTVSTSSATMLRNCATQADYYFPSPDNTTLANAFKTIGDSLSNLRVSK